MANCPNCGGLMKFDIPSQQLNCPYCSNYYDPYSIDKVNNARERDEIGVTVFVCPNCGGQLMSTEYDLSGNCSYCGSPVVFEKRMQKEKCPKLILPFQITKENCKAAYVEAVSKCAFAPDALKDPEHVEGFRGIYVPYWFYEVEQEGEPYKMKVKHRFTSGSYDYTDTYEIEGRNRNLYREIPHDASSVMHDDLSEHIEPFELRSGSTEKIKAFTPSYFAGFYAEPADVAADTYDSYACRIAEERAREYLDTTSVFARFKIGHQLESKHFNSKVTGEKLALLPVWFLSYRKKDRVAYAAVNGQTGRLISDVPIDMGKFAKTFGITALVLFIGMSLLTILPRSVAMLAVFTSCIVSGFLRNEICMVSQRGMDGKKNKKRSRSSSSGWIFGIFAVFLCICLVMKLWMALDDEMSILAAREFYVFLCGCFMLFQLYDVIFCLLKGLTNMSKGHFEYAGILLTFAASLFGTGVLVKAPPQDVYYYFAAILVIAVSLVTMTGLIAGYNRSATRPLPQFEIHRGGDDNA